MWIPDSLYERLPLVYLAAAVACLAFLGVTAGLPSAALFFGAGLLTWTWRRSVRHARPAARSQRRAAASGRDRAPARYASD